MNAKRALDILMSRLGGRTSPELRAKCADEMQLSQERLEGSETLPYFLQSETANNLTKVGDRRLKKPGDMLRESDDDELIYVDAQGIEHALTKGDIDDLQGDFPDSGPPQAYGMRGDYILFFPLPDAEYSVKFTTYYARQSPIIDDASFENAWLKNASDLLISMTGLVIAGQVLKDPELVPVFSQAESAAKTRLFHMQVAWEEANRERLPEE